jgi:low affinity Fe/Cu permease
MQITDNYDIYHLIENPFEDLFSENIKNIDILNINQNIDIELDVIKNEIINKENKVIVAILGEEGIGKTHRLMVFANLAQRNDYLCVLQNCNNETHSAVNELINTLIVQGKNSFSSLKQYKKLLRLKKQLSSAYDPDKIGQVIVEVLNENVPALLLINDFHNLTNSKDLNQFVHILHVIADYSNAGVLVMISSNFLDFKTLMQHYPSLNQRINRQLVISTMNDNEASLMIAKRIISKRIKDDYEEPLYPFNMDVMTYLNNTVNGNPRQLLKTSSFIINQAKNRRAINIDTNLSSQILQLNKKRNNEMTIGNKKEKTIRTENKLLKNTHGSRFTIINDKIPENIKKSKKFLNDSNQNSNRKIKHHLKKDSTSKKIIRKVRVECPQCHSVSIFEVKPIMENISCSNSNCSFIGKITL